MSYAHIGRRLLPSWATIGRAAWGLALAASACQPTSPPAPPAEPWLQGRLLDPGADPTTGRAADVRRLRVALAAPASAKQRFWQLRRLGIYLSFSATPDSGMAPLVAAAQLGQAWPNQFPLAQASVYSRLAQLHWHRQRYANARHYYLQAAQLLATAFADSAAVAATRQLDGLPLTAGVALAGNYANAGQTWRAEGRLPAALACFDQARRAYQRVPDAANSKLSGLAWVHTLFAEALKEQNEPELAAWHYEQALAALRTLRRFDRPDALREWAATLTDYRPQLIASSPPHLLALATEEQADLRRRLRAEPLNRDLLASASTLALLEAQAYLVQRSRATAPALARAAVLLARLRTAAGPEFRAELGYYGLAAQLTQLQAGWNQVAPASPPHQALAYAAQVRAYLDSVAEPGRRARLSLALANEWARQHDYTAAEGLLRPLSQRYARAQEPQALRQALHLLAQSYAAQGRYDSAFRAQSQANVLVDTLHGRQQRAAVAEAETRYRTSLKEIRIRELTAKEAWQRRQNRLAWLGASMLALLLGGVGYALVVTRRLAHRLREARATQDRLYAVIGHDLRTPLTALEGLATLLDYYRQPGLADPALLEEVTTEVRQTTSRLTGLLDNLLFWAANQSGELAYQPEALDAAALLHEVAALYAPAAKARQITVQVSPLADLPPLWADHNMVRTQLRNLLGNALKAAPANSAITLAARAAGPNVELTVTDTGPGLSTAQLATLAAASAGPAPRQPGQRGTGLGLPLVRQLAQRQQSAFWLESAPGQGTTACLALPKAGA